MLLPVVIHNARNIRLGQQPTKASLNHRPQETTVTLFRSLSTIQYLESKYRRIEATLQLYKRGFPYFYWNNFSKWLIILYSDDFFSTKLFYLFFTYLFNVSEYVFEHRLNIHRGKDGCARRNDMDCETARCRYDPRECLYTGEQ